MQDDFDRYQKQLISKWKSWHENGQLDREFSRDGNTEERKFWYDNGQLWNYEFYRDGELDGESKQWHENGQLCLYAFYRKGKLEGKREFWHSNGRIDMQDFWQDGKREGIFKMWNEMDGHCELQEFCRNDEIIDANFTFRKKLMFCRIIKRFRKRPINVANIMLISDLVNVVSQL